MKRFLKNIIAVTYYKFVKFIFLRSTKELSEKNLMFIQTDKIGDIIISSGILEDNCIFSDYDNVYLLIKSKYSKLLENYEGKVKIILFDHKQFVSSVFYNFAFVKYLNKLFISEVYNISQARGQINEILTHITGARVKHVTNNSATYLGERYLNYWNKKYTSLLFWNIENEYEKISRLLYKFSNHNCETTSEKSFFAHKKLNIRNESPYIIVSPYSSEIVKNWDIENYKAIIERLILSANIYVLCSPGEKKSALNDFQDFLSNPKFKISTVNLSEVANIILNSVLFIGNDSGLTHLALKLNIKTIAIIGGGTFGRYFPVPGKEATAKYFYNELDCFKCNWVCKYEKPVCLSNVKVNEVLNYISNNKIL